MKNGASQVRNADILQSFHPVLQNTETLLVNALIHFIKQGASYRNTHALQARGIRHTPVSRFSFFDASEHFRFTAVPHEPTGPSVSEQTRTL